ncbi:MAG: putative baseplate assembly protein [Hyphomicrobium sp.]
MPVTPPRLDDLDFAAIESMLRTRIPVIAPDWTDHNESDPGITLIQLFAHLAEQVGYRLNRVPDKTYVELLKLVGVQLRASVAASALMAFFLTKAERATAVLVPTGTKIKGTGTSGESVNFETDRGLDIIPAQIAALVSTRGELTRINGPGESGPTAASADPAIYVEERFSLAWDGKTPKLKDMPTQPVTLFAKPAEALHTTLYVGLHFNPSVAAGFKGARASLHLQVDNDEHPEPDLSVEAGSTPLSVVNAFEAGPLLVEYEYYRSALAGSPSGAWEPLPVISDGTDSWTRSGTIRFDVPMQIGPIPNGSWADVETDLPHPLVGALKTPADDTPSEVPISGWIRVRFGIAPKISLRSLNFNTATASHLTSVSSERLGRGNGRAGQIFSLGNRDVQAKSFELVSRDDTRAEPILAWRAVDDFDSAGPNDAVYALDAEAGVVIFGDGINGRPPQASELMIVAFYRHGGGKSGEAAAGTINKGSGLPATVAGCTNIVPARGGRDAETLDDAKRRAPRAFRARGRAVTNADFVDAARAAPGVRVARAHVVALRRPYPEGHLLEGIEAPGIDFDREAVGALSVIVVPEQDGLYPMPTTGELRAVAAHLDTVRLLTTEVHVTTPQYVRLHDLQVVVRARPGYSVAMLREMIADHLRKRFHVLTGGPDGRGYSFGGLLHHADLVAEVFKIVGVERVEALSCLFDGITPDNADREMLWRAERRTTLRLTNCPQSPADFDSIDLFDDEVPFIDTASLTVTVVAAP